MARQAARRQASPAAARPRKPGEDKAQAKTVLERFVSNKKANPRNVEEVRKRLAELG